MVDFQLVVAGPTLRDVSTAADEAFAVEQHGAGARVIESIDKLNDIWDTVVTRLSSLAEKTELVASQSRFELDTIEFSLGIEAGLTVGLVTKGDASVTLTFSKARG